jgi:hypothetical protein
MVCRASGWAVLAFAVVAGAPDRLSAADAPEESRSPEHDEAPHPPHERWLRYRDEPEDAGGFLVAAFAVERSLELGGLMKRARSVGASLPPGFAWGGGATVGFGVKGTYVGVMGQLCATSSERSADDVSVLAASGALELRQRLLTLGPWMPYVVGSIGEDQWVVGTSGTATALFDASVVGDDKRFSANRTWVFAGLGLGARTRFAVERWYNLEWDWGLGFEVGRWFGIGEPKWRHDDKNIEGPHLDADGWYLRIALSFEDEFISHTFVPEPATQCDGMLCDLVCNPGWDNCDGFVDNGCETPLNTTAHCGSCGKHCADGHSCQNGRCVR